MDALHSPGRLPLNQQTGASVHTLGLRHGTLQARRFVCILVAMTRLPRHLLARTPWGYQVLWALAWLAAIALAALCSLWGAMALYGHAPPSQPPWPPALVVVWCVAWLLWLGYAIRQRRILTLCVGALVMMLALLVWWGRITPQAQRDWADDVRQQVRVLIDPDNTTKVQLQQVRNFAWRSESDYTPRWETRSYDLQQLRSVDVALSYWMGPAIAHTLVSFGFSDGQHLVFSIEIRKEKHEEFDALAGFFKQYEMVLVAADERDILGVRTNVRAEQVHLYRVQMSPADMRSLFMAYAQQASQLEQAPRFYHTLTANCTTIVWLLARRIGHTLPIDWRLLASGYLPEYLRDHQALASTQPLEVLRSTGDITQRAQRWPVPAGQDDAALSADFSRHIRQDMLP